MFFLTGLSVKHRRSFEGAGEETTNTMIVTPRPEVLRSGGRPTGFGTPQRLHKPETSNVQAPTKMVREAVRVRVPMTIKRHLNTFGTSWHSACACPASSAGNFELCGVLAALAQGKGQFFAGTMPRVGSPDPKHWATTANAQELRLSNQSRVRHGGKPSLRFCLKSPVRPPRAIISLSPGEDSPWVSALDRCRRSVQMFETGPAAIWHRSLEFGLRRTLSVLAHSKGRVGLSRSVRSRAGEATRRLKRRGRARNSTAARCRELTHHFAAFAEPKDVLAVCRAAWVASGLASCIEGATREKGLRLALLVYDINRHADSNGSKRNLQTHFGPGLVARYHRQI
jgi:hypothetical protein